MKFRIGMTFIDPDNDTYEIINIEETYVQYNFTSHYSKIISYYKRTEIQFKNIIKVNNAELINSIEQQFNDWLLQK